MKVKQYLTEWLAKYLFAKTGREIEIKPNSPLYHYGLSSTDQLLLVSDLSKDLRSKLPSTLLFTHPTLTALKDFFRNCAPKEKANNPATNTFFPLTPGQEQILFLHDYFSDKASYNVAACWRLDSAPDLARLQSSFNCVYQAHPILRSHLERRADKSVLVPSDSVQIPWTVRRVENLKTEALSLCEEERAIPFLLEKGPLLRILTISDGIGAVLQITAHHLCLDHWSLQILLEQWSATYNKHTEKHPGDIDSHEQAPIIERQIFSHTFGKEKSETIRKFARENNTTVFGFFLSILTLLFARRSHQPPLFGLNCSGRTDPASQKVIGCFVRVLPFQAVYEAQSSFCDLLKTVRQQLDQTLLRQDIPWHPKGNGAAPFFEVLLNHLEPHKEFYFGESPLVPLEINDRKAKFPLTVTIAERKETINLLCNFQFDRHSKREIEKLLQQAVFLTDQVIGAPDRRITQYTLAPNLAEPLSCPLPKRRLSTLAEILDRAFKNFPSRPALNDGSSTLDYKTLEQAVSKREAELAPQVNPGHCVPVHGKASKETIVTLLALIRLRAVILLLDENLPPDRKRIMLEESQKKLIEPPESNDASFVFFTSGSSGVPKGIVGNAQGISHYVQWFCQTYSITEHDRIGSLYNISFEPFLRDLFIAFHEGAELILQDVHVPDLRKMTVLHTVPSIAEHIIKEKTKEQLSQLRIFILGGEPLKESLIRQWRALLSDKASIINIYGPTETTLAKTHYVVPPHCRPGIQPLGAPIPDCEIYIMNQERLCDAGEIGEIVIRTPFCSKGYLNQEPARFCPNPFTQDSGDLLYYTGDLGVIREENVLEILGRVDDEIKIHGVRIHPKEIEHQLAHVPGVRNAHVAVRRNPEGPPTLTAYYTADRPLLSSELTRPLQSYFSSSVIPRHFVYLERFPLTPNGKIDSNLLPPPNEKGEPSVELPTAHDGFTAMFLDIVRQILEVDHPTLADNFFDLGGHSLTATRLTSALRNHFQVELEIRTFLESPTLGDLARHIRELMEQKVQSALPPIVPTPARRTYPLSYPQWHLWFTQLLDPDSPRYNPYRLYRLKGEVSYDRLNKALQQLIQQHPSLRTSFKMEGEDPVQEVHETVPFQLQQFNFSMEAIASFIERPFNLSRSPLIRAALIKIAPEQFYLLICIHHIVCDAWSTSVLLRDLDTFWRKECPANSPPSVTYADFALWQRHLMEKGLWRPHHRYWEKQLKDAPSTITLPYDAPWPTTLGCKGGRVEFQLPASFLERLRTIVSQEQSTLFMLLLTTFRLLLHRLSGQNDIVIGVPIAGRRMEALESVIGFFINMLPVRLGLAPSTSFVSQLQREKENLLGVYTYQDYPFAKMVELIPRNRQGTSSPLFQAVFNYQNVPRTAFKLDGIQTEEEQSPLTIARDPLALHLLEENKNVKGAFIFNQDLFQKQTVQAMCEQFLSLLEQIAENPNRLMESYLLRDTKALARQKSWSESKTPRNLSHPLEKFYQMAEQYPDRPAIQQDGQILSYRDLVAVVEDKAKRLQKLGTESGTRVAVAGTTSIDVFQAILACMRIGATIIPIDTALPYERHLAILKTAKAQMILRTPSDDHEVAFDFLPTYYYHDLPQTSVTTLPPLEVDAIPYIFFTSGSSGRPKGICGRWQALAHVIEETSGHLSITSDDRIAQLYTIGFEPVLRELFLALTNGALLILPPKNNPKVPQEILRWIASEKVTIVHTVPSIASLWVTEAGPISLPSVRKLIVGGEPFSESLVQSLQRHFEGDILNIYGPTETTLHCMMYEVGHPPIPGIQPIGQSLSGIDCLILSGDRPCGTNELGEIVIRNRYHLGSSYLSNVGPEEQKRFCSNPLTKDPKDIVYRTGDLGRFHPSDFVTISGRNDDEIKINGIRIHPQEIEQTLALHSSVLKCAVISKKGEGQESYLAAYITGKPALKIEDLRGWLAHRLPPTFIPKYFVPVSDIPFLPNGKSDKFRLPDPIQYRREETKGAPATPSEQWLVSTLEVLLERNDISTTDNFFDLGGHSLMATRLLARIRSTFEIEILLKDIFAAVSIRELAQKIDEALQNPKDGSTRSIPVADRQQRLPLSYSQQRLWVLHQFDPKDDGFNLTRRRRLIGKLFPKQMEDIFRTIIKRHDSLRTAFLVDEEGPYQQVRENVLFHVPLHDLSQFSEKEARRRLGQIVSSQEKEPFNLKEPPLLRVSLVKFSETHHILILTIHHIVCDGWSIHNILSEAILLWGSLQKAIQPQLPPLPVQYPDYAVWQRGLLNSDRLSKQLEYWREHLGNTPPILKLPCDKPWPAVLRKAGARVDFIVLPSLLQKLKERARENQVTLFMLLMSSYRLLLSRLSNQKEIIIGTPIAGRQRLELESAVGFFINMLPLRVDLEESWTLSQLLERERVATLQAYAHQEVPFDKLVETLQCDRHPNRPPLYQTVLNLRNMPRRQFRLEGIRGENVPQETTFSRDPLLLNLTEIDEHLEVSFIYNADLFTKPRVELLRDQWLSLLKQIAGGPNDLPLSTLRLKDSQSMALWERWKSPMEAPKIPHPLHAVRERALRTPRKIAIAQGHRRLTYHECWERVERIGRALWTGDMRDGMPVGIVGGRSLDMVVALLGVLRAGGVTVPCDHHNPRERTQTLLRETQSEKIIRVQTSVSLPNSLTLEQLERTEAGDPTVLPPLRKEGPAYIFFTSGSTGTPKGIVGSLQGFSHYHHWLSGELKVTPKSRIAQLYTPGFEPFMRETLLALGNGARLVIPPEERSDPKELIDWLEQEKITLFHTIPSIGRLLVSESSAKRRLPSLRTVVFGGEPLDQQLIEQWRKAFHGRVINIYGPTETTMAKTFYVIPKQPLPGIQPLGFPIPQTEVLVLRNDQPCAVGEIGEIVIRTPFRSLGYLPSVPEKDRQRFRPNPLTGDSNDIVYYTGDTGHYNKEGTLSIAGRMDDEFKIMGIRIHPAEIEQRLLQHPHIESVAVMAVPQADPGKRLIAYYVATQSLTPQNLRRWLASTVLSAALPTFYVPVEAIPLTQNGKVDKQRLLTQFTFSNNAPSHAVLMTPREKEVLKIVTDVLGHTDIQMEDNFFAQGGNSLQAVRVVTKIRELFSGSVSIQSFFEAETLRDFCSRLPQKKETAGIPIHSRFPRNIPLSYTQERMWNRHHQRPDDHSVHILRAMEIRGPFSIEKVRNVIEALIARHTILRTRFGENKKGPFQTVHRTTSAPIEVRTIQPSAVPSHLRRQKLLRFDLSKPPLLRVGVLRLEKQKHLLYFVLHHIIGDGWSIHLLLREFSLLWNKAPLPPLSVQYHDYALWQRNGRTIYLKNELQYWRSHLGEALPVFGTKTTTVLGKRIPVKLPPEAIAAAQQTAESLSTTPFVIYLSLFRYLISKYFRARETIISIQTAGRSHEVENVLGPFVNILPLRGFVNETMTLRTLIEQEQKSTTSAYQHQEVPIQWITAHYGTPYQIHFNYRNMGEERLRLNHLEIKPNRYEYQTEHNYGAALALNIREHQGRVHGFLQYDPTQFSAELLEKMMRELAKLAVDLHRLADIPLSFSSPGEKKGDMNNGFKEKSDQKAKESLPQRPEFEEMAIEG